MCGLVGVFGPGMYAGREIFRELLFLDTLRGYDSTGVVALGSNSVEVIKKPIPGYDFIQTQQYHNKVHDRGQLAGLMGHNRWATKGKVTLANSHPFEHGKIILMHNGTLRSYNDLPKVHFDTDSEAATYAVDELGIQETINRIVGAFAFAWYNIQEDTINLVRNEERPLFIAKLKSNKIVYASEAWMIHAAVGRHKHEEIASLGQLDTFTHLSYPAASAKPAEDVEVRKLEKPPVKKYQWDNTTSHGQSMTKTGEISKQEQDAQTARVRRINKILKRYDVKIGDSVLFQAAKWEPYPVGHGKTNTGKVMGWSQEEPKLQVEVHNCGMNEFLDGEEYMGVISGVRVYRFTEQGKSAERHVLVLEDCIDIDINDDEDNEEEVEGNIVPFELAKADMKFIGPKGALVSLAEYRTLIEGGCGICHDKFKMKDWGNIEFGSAGQTWHDECLSDWRKTFN